MAKKTKGKRGVRYTDKEKTEIIQFVQDHDQANGRGGQSAAAKKFGVSTLSIANWSKKTGRKTVAAAPKKKAARKQAAAAPSAGPVSGGVTATLKRMIAIQERLEALQAEYGALKSQL